MVFICHVILHRQCVCYEHLWYRSLFHLVLFLIEVSSRSRGGDVVAMVY